MVKVFGCREAYENLPSTNLRAGGDGLWGFGVLPGRGDGGAGVAMASVGGERGFSLDRPWIEGSLRLMSRSFALILATSVRRSIGRNGCVAA